jgi:hypothetical protein
MWSQEQSDEIQTIARETIPDGVLEFLKERWISLIEK